MEDNPVLCKLKIPKDLGEKTPLFLVDFSNGNLNLHHSNKLKFSCYRQERLGSSGVKRVLIADSGYYNYQSGSEEISDDSKKFSYYVGVRSKTCRRMKIFDAMPFHLKPVLNESGIQSTTPETRNFRERRDDLEMNFGSKGKKRSTVARLKYSMGSTSLDDALDDISLDDSVGKANSSLTLSNTPSDFDYLPPKNHEAQTVEQVYEISSIISAEEDEYLDESAEELLNNFSTHFTQWKIDGTFCEYVLDHLEGKDLNYITAKYLLYYNYLVIFSKLLSADIRKKDPAPLIPEPIKSCLLDRFTVVTETVYGKSARTYPLKMKDKLLAYILVLALIIDDYHINLAQIQKGMKYGLPKLNNIAQALGCHVRRSTVDNCAVSFAELKLPLFVLHKGKKR